MCCRPPASTSPYPRLFVLAALFAAAGCSSGGGTVAPVNPGPALVVTSVAPPDGAVGVGILDVVYVTFAEPVSSLGDRLTVEDGAGPLPGFVDANLDGTVWKFHPARPLPRGGNLRVRIAAGTPAISGATLPVEFTSAFTVQPLQVGPGQLLGQAAIGPVAAMLWTTGPAAVVNGARMARVDGAAPGTFPVPLTGVLEIAAQDQAGSYVAVARDGLSPFVLEAARGAAGGTSLLATIAAPAATFGRCELAVDASGDAAVYCFGMVGQVAYEGLWTLRAGAVDWFAAPLADAGSFPLRRLAVDGLGNPFLAWVDDTTGRLVLQRNDVPQGTSRTFDVAPLPQEYALAAMGNGDCRVFWHERHDVAGTDLHYRLFRRYTAGGTLGAPVEIARGEAFVDREFVAADNGTAVAVYEQPVGGPTYLQRFEFDGQNGAAAEVAPGPLPLQRACAISQRGYAVLAYVAHDATFGDEVRFVVSQPGQAPTLPRVGYRVDIETTPILRIDAAIDDAGRVLLGIVEGGVQSTEVLYGVLIE